MVITDVDGIILSGNPAVTELTGYTAKEAVGQTPRILKSGKHTAPFYKKLWENDPRRRHMARQLHQSPQKREPYFDEHTITPIRSEDGKTITHFVAVMNDVTVRKQAEAAWGRAKDGSANWWNRPWTPFSSMMTMANFWM